MDTQVILVTLILTVSVLCLAGFAWLRWRNNKRLGK